MSLSGLRDLSVLKTPPVGRKEITTLVTQFNESLIHDAIEKEISRGGQTFYVVPRIAQIDMAIETIKKLVPHARIAVAHGRLKQVEDRIIEFAEGSADVLIATSVIESGLDLPNANTIIGMGP
jgi:transcription-repair coupling factor (superfamily II helicase)